MLHYLTNRSVLNGIIANVAVVKLNITILVADPTKVSTIPSKSNNPYS
jgi:hypothetical protein